MLRRVLNCNSSPLSLYYIKKDRVVYVPTLRRVQNGNSSLCIVVVVVINVKAPSTTTFSLSLSLCPTMMMMMTFQERARERGAAAAIICQSVIRTLARAALICAPPSFEYPLEHPTTMYMSGRRRARWMERKARQYIFFLPKKYAGVR